jgi:hypothetical protein
MRNTIRKIRSFVAGSALALLILALTGCGGSSTTVKVVGTRPETMEWYLNSDTAHSQRSTTYTLSTTTLTQPTQDISLIQTMALANIQDAYLSGLIGNNTTAAIYVRGGSSVSETSASFTLVKSDGTVDKDKLNQVLVKLNTDLCAAMQPPSEDPQGRGIFYVAVYYN